MVNIMTHFTTIRIRGACVIACLCGLLFMAGTSHAQLRPNIGTASTYAVFTGAGSIISKAISYPVIISVEATSIALTVSLVIGIVAGVYPAWRAAKLAPIDALRNE